MVTMFILAVIAKHRLMLAPSPYPPIPDSKLFTVIMPFANGAELQDENGVRTFHKWEKEKLPSTFIIHDGVLYPVRTENIKVPDGSIGPI